MECHKSLRNFIHQRKTLVQDAKLIHQSSIELQAKIYTPMVINSHKEVKDHLVMKIIQPLQMKHQKHYMVDKKMNKLT